MEFIMIADSVELNDEKSGSVYLFERHFFNKQGIKIIEYYTEDSERNRRNWEATKDPEVFTEEERHRVLDYCLGKGNYHVEEIVNYHDLFIQAEFIKEIVK